MAGGFWGGFVSTTAAFSYTGWVAPLIGLAGGAVTGTFDMLSSMNERKAEETRLNNQLTDLKADLADLKANKDATVLDYKNQKADTATLRSMNAASASYSLAGNTNKVFQEMNNARIEATLAVSTGVTQASATGFRGRDVSQGEISAIESNPNLSDAEKKAMIDNLSASAGNTTSAVIGQTRRLTEQRLDALANQSANSILGMFSQASANYYDATVRMNAFEVAIRDTNRAYEQKASKLNAQIKYTEDALHSVQTGWTGATAGDDTLTFLFGA